MLYKLKQHYDSLFLIIGNAISRVFMIISTVIMIRLLGDMIYSKYALLYNGLLGIQVFLTLGLNAVLIKKIASGEDVLYTLTKVIKIISIISLVFLTLFGVFLKNNWINALSYFNEINFLYIIFSVVSIVFFSILISLLYGLEEKNKIAKMNIFNSICLFVCLIYFSIKTDLNLIFMGLGIAHILSIFYFFIFYRNTLFKKCDFLNKKNIMNQLQNSSIDYIKQGVPVFLSALLVTPIIGVIYTFMNSKGLGEQIAIFSVAMQWYSIILFIPGVLANLLLAEFSKNKNVLTLEFYFKRVFLNFLITVFTSIFVYFLLLFILPIYGKDYENNFYVFLIFIFVGLVNSFNTVAGQFFIAINKQMFGFYCNIIWAVLVLTLVFYVLNKGYGILGVALSFLISYLIHAFNQNLYIYFFLKGDQNV